MARSPQWVTVKKELYQHVLNQVQQRWGRIGKQIQAYSKNYISEKSDKWKLADKDELFFKIAESRVIVLGDFHSLHQSQRSHMRIIKNIQLEDFKIALECVAFQHQKYVDQYLSGDLSEKEFVKKVNWKKNWGFPWEHYREIFEFAKVKRKKILALNDLRLMNFKDSLLKRDRVASKIIDKELSSSQDPIFIIYGELHLSSKSFYAFKRKHKNVNVLKVYQNIDNIYFQLMQQNKEAEVDVVRLSDGDYCLLNVPPWVKWQSYLMFLEKKYDSEIEEENPDYTDYVDQYIKVISKELDMQIDSKNLSVYTSNDFSFLKKMKKELTDKEFAFYELLIEEEKSFYLPKLGIGYLGRITINQAAALAMQYIYFEKLKLRRMPTDLPKDFIKLIWVEAICYFGSKIINPKRKTETIKDIKNKVNQFGSKKTDKEALKLALFQKTKELMVLAGRNFSSSRMLVQKDSSYILCANLLGSMMGEKLYKGYREQVFSLSFLKMLFNKRIDNANFDKTYYETIEIIENLPESFKSKADKL